MTEEQNTPLELDLPNIGASSTIVAQDAKVQVQIEKIAERQRQITAAIQIPHPTENVWKVLTNYEALADFIPNLAKSRRIAHPTGGIRLEQIGSGRFLRLNFCARVILDLEEYELKEINFRMVEGDFKEYSGSWCLEPYSLPESTGTYLYYKLKVWAKLTMPINIVENHLSKSLQSNLLAISQRVEQLSCLHSQT